MRDLEDVRAIHAKGWLFLALGLLSGGALLVESPTATTAALLAVSVWAFARFYYYAFYVVERYVDPAYRFAGLGSFARYWLKRRQR